MQKELQKGPVPRCPWPRSLGTGMESAGDPGACPQDDGPSTQTLINVSLCYFYSLQKLHVRNYYHHLKMRKLGLRSVH